MFQKKKDENATLSVGEARLVAKWLDTIGKAPEQGHISIWKLTPEDIAALYKVEKEQVLAACRRN
jgi:hypothetical protein